LRAPPEPPQERKVLPFIRSVELDKTHEQLDIRDPLEHGGKRLLTVLSSTPQPVGLVVPLERDKQSLVVCEPLGEAPRQHRVIVVGTPGRIWVERRLQRVVDDGEEAQVAAQRVGRVNPVEDASDVFGNVPFRTAVARRAPQQSGPQLRIAEQLPLGLGLRCDGYISEHD
jgi:hypothetical protein